MNDIILGGIIGISGAYLVVNCIWPAFIYFLNYVCTAIVRRANITVHGMNRSRTGDLFEHIDNLYFNSDLSEKEVGALQRGMIQLNAEVSKKARRAK